ncbi:helix-hairpin-helix domain-containing protein [Virgibacillus sp. DJP39]|uniref:helix-hairpin-helix domain-containing protein n=1 Tax=Virgibacillus sp. DJP39 TaxID=3409790 RepID=UPI003BB67E81
MINFLKRNLLFAVLGVAVVVFVFVLNDKPSQEKSLGVKPLQAASTIKPKEVHDATKVFVDVKGEVKSPGVYEMATGSRVEAVISTAGGFTMKADQSVINLAQKVHDEMIILVPKVGEQITKVAQGSPSYNKINLNYAKQEDIEQLNGIGPSKAQAIIKYREDVGLFDSIEDVLNVPGIGKKTLDNMKDSIQLP